MSDEHHDREIAEDVLELFNAEGVVEHPGEPEESEPESPASDADAPAPPG